MTLLSKSLASFLALATVSAVATDTPAATWRVAQDGSGDFALVQDAVEAAATGDTVSIGPGVYPELRDYPLPGGGTLGFVALVEVDELTILGDDKDIVVLGPAVQAPNVELGPTGIVTRPGKNVRVSGVTVRNVSAGVNPNGEWAEISDSRFVGCDMGIRSVLTGFLTVIRIETIETLGSGVVVFRARGGTGARIDDSLFADSLQFGVDVQTDNSSISNCSFERNTVALQISFGGSAEIADCRFVNSVNVDLPVINGAEATVVRNRFEGFPGANVFLDGVLEGSHNYLSGGSVATFRLSGRSAVRFNNNHILNAGGLSVLAGLSSQSVPPHDFERNYWGTTNTDQIDEWILDENDEDGPGFALVDYLPLAESPISSESTSFGELKSRFNSNRQ